MLKLMQTLCAYCITEHGYKYMSIIWSYDNLIAKQSADGLTILKQKQLQN